MNWIRNHALMVAVVAAIPLVQAIYAWSEYGYFCDQAREHGTEACPGFWATEHLHDFIYNVVANWQSDLIVGILFVMILNKIEGPRGADKDDT